MQEHTQDLTLGFIGVGNMGGPMARNLVAAAQAVLIYDIDPDAVRACVEAGARAAASVGELVSHSDVVLTSLPYSHTFVEVAERDMLSAAREGQVFVDLGTVRVLETQRLACAFAAKGATLLDVPVSGGRRGAETGTLRMFGSGDQATFERMRPLLHLLGDPKHVAYCGKSGMGQVVKGVNQLGMGLPAAAALEAVAFGVLAGADPEAIDVAVGGDDGWRKRIRDTVRAIGDGTAEQIAVKFGQLAHFLETAAAAGFKMPLTQALQDVGKDAEPCVMDANRLSPSFWRELQHALSAEERRAIEYAKNRAYQFVAGLQQALDEGQITEAEWFERNDHFFTPIYLAAGDPRAQSGHSGGETQYRYTRMMVLEAIHTGGSFLDVGCANGYLIESLHRWLEGSGLAVAFYGLDISAGLIELARRRLPHWHDRFFLGNALYWTPEQPFDFVCTAELGYVPRDRRQALIDHLFDRVVAPGGRLILGPFSEERDKSDTENQVRAWGYTPAGYCEKAHHSHKQLCKRLFWFDKE